MAKDKSVEITIAGQTVRFEIVREGGVYFAKPHITSQRFSMPPVYYGVAKTPGKALEKCKEIVGPYLLSLNDSLRA